MIEDSELDAELMLHALKKGDYQVEFERVERADEMKAALLRQEWDVVISDYSLPQFSGKVALDLLKESGQDIPFIIISGTIGEETAVEMMKSGVHDYLTKDNLTRLAPAIAREIEQAQSRRERKSIEDVLYFLTERSWEDEGEDYFFAVARYLGEALPVDYVVIDRVKDEKTAQTLANFWLGEARPNFEYLLEDTPCGTIFGQRQCTYAENVQEQFPKDTDLVDMGAESYSGIPLWDSHGTPIGLIAVLEQRPVKYKSLVEAILRIVANHVGHEIERQEAEAELRRSEARFRSLVEHAPEAIVVLDPEQDFIFVDVNQNACEFYKFSREELLTKGPIDLSPRFAPDGRPTAEVALEMIQKALDGENPRFEWIHLDSQGREIPCEVNLARLPSSTGWLVRGSVVDITERKRAERALRESEERFRNLFEGAITGILVHHETKPILVNPVFAKMLGYEQGEILSMDSVMDMIAPYERERLLGYYEARKNGEPAPNQYEYDALCKDGSSIPFESFVTKVPWKGMEVTMSAIVDIAERKRAEEALRTSEAHLSNALKMAGAGHWEYDVASDTFTFNDIFYRIFGITANDVGGYQMSSVEYAQRFCHPDDMDMVRQETEAAIATSDPLYTRQLEHRILDSNGQIGYMAVRFFIVKDAEGRTIKTYGVNQNITERKRTEIQLQEQLNELRRWHDVTIGREERILDLKREVNELLLKDDKEPRYSYSRKMDKK